MSDLEPDDRPASRYAGHSDARRAVLRSAAPAALVDFALGAIIEKEDPDDVVQEQARPAWAVRRKRPSVFAGVARPGPLLRTLGARARRRAAPRPGTGRARDAVAARPIHRRAAGPSPRISIPFSGGTKSFEGDWAVYHWARSAAPSVITASALMALEAWGHRQIEAESAVRGSSE